MKNYDVDDVVVVCVIDDCDDGRELGVRADDDVVGVAPGDDDKGDDGSSFEEFECGPFIPLEYCDGGGCK